MHKNYIYIGGIVAVLAVVAVGFFVLNNYIYQEKQADPIPTQFSELFQEEVVSRGVETIGQPIEGFDAFLLLQAFAGLQESDFHGVLSFEGVYRYENGELVYERNAGMPVTSAEQAVSDEGYAVLLENTASRFGIEINDHQVVFKLVDALEEISTTPPLSPNPTPAPGFMTMQGEITCLPKVGSGPHTMECAIGLKGDDGNHYALKNLFEYDPDYYFSTTGMWVEVAGIFRVEETPGPGGSTYDVVGTIEITSISDISSAANECNVAPDANGQCPAGCVNYGIPLGCVTQEYYDQCQSGTTPCPL